MSRTIAAFVGLFIALLCAHAVGADHGDSALISQIEAQRYGLARAWFTQVRLDPARARMTDMIYFVSATQSHTVYEVQYLSRKRVFSERDTDHFGDLMGKEKAEKEANAFIEELKTREIESKLQTIQVPETTLYAVTDRAVLHAIDAETGRTRWTTVVGNRDYPVERPGISENYVAVLNGSTLHLLKRQTGEMAWIRAIQGVASAGPALTAEYVIVPTFSGDVELYDIEETRTLPEIYRSNGRVLIQPIVTPMSVLWPTDRGLLYAAQTTQKGLRYRMEAKRAIVSQAAYASPNKVLAASVDGYVYCLHEISGDELWRFSSGEAISNSPVPIGDSVYVVTDKGSLFCLNLENGQEKWSAPQVRRLISVSKDRLYCLTVTGRLAILDVKTGGRIALMGTNQLDVFYSNTLTDRILVGTTTGVVQCLHEVELQWPLVHVNLAEAVQQQRPEIKQEGLEPKAKPAAKPAAPGEKGDPFGAGGAPKPAADPADPFGGGAAPKPAADPADPFGGGGAKPKAGNAKPPAGAAAADSDPFN